MSARLLHNTSGAVNSRYKIKCHGPRIMVGDREFISASEALEAYISQYEDGGGMGDAITGKLYSSTASDLLNPKSALYLTAERSLQTGVRDTEEELKLADAKDSINESMIQMKKTVKLKAKVEEALDRSQELMDKISGDTSPDKTCPSDIGSLNTEVLVNMSPIAGYNQPQTNPPSWKSKHVFSYKIPGNRRSRTVGGADIARDLEQLSLRQSQEAGTQSTANRNLSSRVTFQDKLNAGGSSPSKQLSGVYDDDVSLLLGDTSPSRINARASERKLRERSRSVSPSILKRERKLYEVGARSRPVPEEFQDFDVLGSSSHRTPSWIDSMDLSDVRDNVWKQRDFTTSRPPPSWIQDIEGSDITSVGPASKPIKPLQLHDLLRPLPVITNTSNQDSSINSDTINDPLPPPGLTYRDLVGDSSRLNNQSYSNTNLNDNQNNNDGLSMKLKNLEKKTNAALSRYKDRMDKEEQSLTFSPVKSGAGGPRCSSLDTTALLAGICQPGHSDITGASPIVLQDTWAGNSGNVSAASSPGKQRRPQSPDTDMVLEGDRPWEKIPSYKIPVSVGDQRQENNTLTGSSQPGSLEALKNMIFKLQQEASVTESDEEHSRALSQKVQQLRNEAADLGIGTGSSEKLTGDIPSLKGYNFQAEPGGQSLEKALVHLDRLKTLVQSSQTEKNGQKSRESSPVRPLCAHMLEN